MIEYIIHNSILLACIGVSLWGSYRLKKKISEFEKYKNRESEWEMDFSKKNYEDLQRQIDKDYAELKNAALDKGYKIKIYEYETKNVTEDENTALDGVKSLAVLRAMLDIYIEKWDESQDDEFCSAHEVSSGFVAVFYVRRLSEEEKMQHKMLKEIGII